MDDSVTSVGGSSPSSPRCACSMAAATPNQAADADSVVTSAGSAPSGRAQTKNRAS
jgi:hypothetical protein